MSNAASVAKAIGAEFRYAWPRAHPEHLDIEVNRQEEIFSSAFRAKYEISAEAIDELEMIDAFEPDGLTLFEARAIAIRSRRDTYVEASKPIGIVRFRDETREEATSRFRQAFNSFAWLPEIEQKIEGIRYAAAKTFYSAMHVRRGDLIVGAWRQFLAYEKYIPTQFYTYVVTNAAIRGKKILALSDDGATLEFLTKAWDEITLIDDFIPGLRDMTELQRALLEIIAMSAATRIVGPPSSAFSGLAGALSGRSVVQPSDLCPPDVWPDVLLTKDNRGECTLHPAIQSRDACWALDVLDEDLTDTGKRELSQDALDKDGEFSGAFARRARILARAGDQAGADAALAEAKRLAESATDTYLDPLFHFQCTVVEITCRRILTAIDRGVVERDDAGSIDLSLRTVSEAVGACFGIQPFMIPNVHAVLFNLRFQLLAIEAIVADARAGISPGKAMDVYPPTHVGPLEALTRRLMADPLLPIIEGFSAELVSRIRTRARLESVLYMIRQQTGRPYSVGNMGYLLSDLLDNASSRQIANI